MKRIYGRWSGFATMWIVLGVAETGVGVFELIAGTGWSRWVGLWMLALAAFAGLMLRRELRNLKAGREREQASIDQFTAAMQRLAESIHRPRA